MAIDVEVVFFSFLHCKVNPISPFSYSPIYKKVIIHSPDLRSGKIYSPYLNIKWLCILFGLFFCMRDLPLLPHLLIYLIMYLYQFEFMNFCLYFGLIIQQYIINFFIPIIPVLAIENSLSWLLYIFDLSSLSLVIFFSISLLSASTKCLHLVYFLSQFKIQSFL